MTIIPTQNGQDQDIKKWQVGQVSPKTICKVNMIKDKKSEANIENKFHRIYIYAKGKTEEFAVTV